MAIMVSPADEQDNRQDKGNTRVLLAPDDNWQDANQTAAGQ